MTSSDESSRPITLADIDRAVRLINQQSSAQIPYPKVVYFHPSNLRFVEPYSNRIKLEPRESASRNCLIVTMSNGTTEVIML